MRVRRGEGERQENREKKFRKTDERECCMFSATADYLASGSFLIYSFIAWRYNQPSSRSILVSQFYECKQMKK